MEPASAARTAPSARRREAAAGPGVPARLAARPRQVATALRRWRERRGGRAPVLALAMRPCSVARPARPPVRSGAQRSVLGRRCGRSLRFAGPAAASGLAPARGDGGGSRAGVFAAGGGRRGWRRSGPAGRVVGLSALGGRRVVGLRLCPRRGSRFGASNRAGQPGAAARDDHGRRRARPGGSGAAVSASCQREVGLPPRRSLSARMSPRSSRTAAASSATSPSNREPPPRRSRPRPRGDVDRF